MTEQQKWYGTGEVADLYEVTARTVIRWADDGKIPHIKTPGGTRRYPVDKIDELYEAMKYDGV